jgi:hypothetical protein
MIKFIRIESILLLLFLGISAIAGSLPLIIDPSGNIIGLPLRLLEHSPFSSFLIPGVIFIFIFVLRKSTRTPMLITYQGIVLVIWISVQLLIIRSTHILHLIYGLLGMILVVSGMYLYNRVKKII